MQNKVIFQGKQELVRLSVQNQLLQPYEAPVLEQLFSGRTGLKLLDIGCNDGSKTTAWFSSDAVSDVIGLEYNNKLAEKAQSEYGGEKYSFHACDVESADFPEKLRSLMQLRDIDRFDVIYLSLVLMHLKHPDVLLRQLHSVLAPGGSLVILESCDEATRLPQESMGLLAPFFAMLQQDPYAGCRTIGPNLPELSVACGYTDPVVWFDSVDAHPGEQLKKEAIFQSLFSYLPEDTALLCAKEPENPVYRQWMQWLEQHFEALRQAILREDTPVSMGVRLFTCRRACQ